MAQDYGLAQPIADAFKKITSFFSEKKPAPEKKEAMNWKPEANEEQKEQMAGRKKLTADGPTLGGKKKAKAKTQKAPARKKG